MKKEYESPALEVLNFDVRDSVMDSDCTTYTGGTCPYDGICTIDVNVPNISSV
jgi:hypothetical protein